MTMRKFSVGYRCRYRWALWRGGVPMHLAMNYPLPFMVSDGDPLEDAEAELDAMRDSF